MANKDKQREMRAFSARLESACDAAGIPGFRHGRQSHFKRELGVSPEAVRRWFSAESIPRQETIRKLARMLKVDPAWLQYGTRSDEVAVNAPPDSQASVLYVASIMQFAGFTVAFEGVGDADFIAIKRGLSYHVKVVPSRDTPDGVAFEVPYDFDRFYVVGVARDGDNMKAFIIEDDHLASARVRNVKRVVVVDGDWAVGGVPLKRLTLDGIENGTVSA